jgi:hypothetical protein
MGFTVRKCLRTWVIDFKPIDMKIMWFKKQRQIPELQYYLCTCSSRRQIEVEKDKFYEQLERTDIHCPSYDIKITFDLKAKIRNES